jgi:hypothetical protein
MNGHWLKTKARDAICQRAREEILPSENFYTDKEIEEKVQNIKDDLNKPCYSIFSEAYLDLEFSHGVLFTIKDIDMDKFICV